MNEDGLYLSQSVFSSVYRGSDSSFLPGPWSALDDTTQVWLSAQRLAQVSSHQERLLW